MSRQFAINAKYNYSKLRKFLQENPGCAQPFLPAVTIQNSLRQCGVTVVEPGFPTQGMASSSTDQQPQNLVQTAEDMASSSQNQETRPKTKKTPENIGLDLGLAVARALFMNRNTIPERSFKAVWGLNKKMVKTSIERSDVRHSLGENDDIWKDYVLAFETAIPVLEEQSLVPEDNSINANAASSAANRSCSNLMVQNYMTLKSDLDILNDLVLISRNIVLFEEAQNLSHKHSYDQVMMALIDLCVRVTTRGYDGDAGSHNETQWANIIQGYKTLLVSSLQFLANMIYKNEKRTFVLWLDLFASSRSADPHSYGKIDPRKEAAAMASGGNTARSAILKTSSQTNKSTAPDQVIKKEIENFVAAGDTRLGKGDVDEITNRIQKTMDGIIDKSLEKDHQLHVEATLANKVEDLQITQPTQDTTDPDKGVSTIDRQSHSSIDPISHMDTRASVMKFHEIVPDRTPQSAAIILQKAKDHLMARIQEGANGEETYDQDKFVHSENDEDGDVRGSDVAAHGSAAAGDDGDLGEYHEQGDQDRGLLTDIPLVLGITEIEALPLIIQSGIVNFAKIDVKGKGAANMEVQGEQASDAEAQDKKVPGTEEHGLGSQDLYSVRCNILLSQDLGRNLLRELLIFIAAWDLPDDHTYFKLMMQIMEAILDNGLMPFAYQAFAEEKDIVSPAQSMIIKLLTQIFRGKQSLVSGTGVSGTANLSSHRENPSRTDTLMVRNIFMTFRQIIIPETCALIFLQGQIRANAASPDDFPLNLWDMERVYEGVYQFLEFFAVLTESEDWKGRLVQWEVVSELVTLLRELDASIPKAPLGSPRQASASMEAGSSAVIGESQSPQPQAAHAPVAVERPYDQVILDSDMQPDYADGGASETASATNQAASEFEWRNLKKLVVLVLSSLVWKSTTVQTQIRQYGGVEMILACCPFDENNPYIREHAIMCLRFLLEGNKENQEIVRTLQPKRTVPVEVLDKRGYETYIDDKGKVGLRAKDGTIS